MFAGANRRLASGDRVWSGGVSGRVPVFFVGWAGWILVVMMVWEQGRAVVDYLIRQGLLRIVPPSAEDADVHLEAARHKARLVKDAERSNPAGAFVGAYGAMRDAWTAVLVVQGLQPVAADDHPTIAAALMGQLHPPLGRTLKRFDWMYRTLKAPEHSRPTASQLRNATQILEQTLTVTAQLVELMPPYRPNKATTPAHRQPAPKEPRVK